MRVSNKLCHHSAYGAQWYFIRNAKNNSMLAISKTHKSSLFTCCSR